MRGVSYDIHVKNRVKRKSKPFLIVRWQSLFATTIFWSDRNCIDLSMLYWVSNFAALGCKVHLLVHKQNPIPEPSS